MHPNALLDLATALLAQVLTFKHPADNAVSERPTLGGVLHALAFAVSRLAGLRTRRGGA